MSWFQDHLAAFFERRSMTSQETLVSKVGHEHWDKERKTLMVAWSSL